MHRNAIYVLLLTVAGLTALGLVMLFSTGAFAPESQGDIYYFVKRQGMWLGVAVVGAIAAACINYEIWRKTWWLFFAVAFVLLLLCFVPGIGMKINGSELAKIASLFFLAWWFTRFEKKSETLLLGLLAPLAILGILVAPILMEVDLGASALIMGTAVAVMFLAGASLRWLGLFAIIGLVGIIYGATHIDERMGRLLAFVHPDKYPDEFYQQQQGLIAIGSGGIDGLGLGAGRQKLMYLPYAHTDFIFPMVAEELGLKFSLLTVFGYLLICLCGTIVAANARDRFGMLLGFGCIMMISLQAVVNIGVTTAMLPNKGMPLPFVSFGGSNLAVCYFMIGILINIHRHGIPLAERVSPVLRRVRNSCRL
jgi:cell division protein FtsW